MMHFCYAVSNKKTFPFSSRKFQTLMPSTVANIFSGFEKSAQNQKQIQKKSDGLMMRLRYLLQKMGSKG